MYHNQANIISDDQKELLLQKRLVHLGKGRAPIAYDVLSIDVGITPSSQGVPGALKHATPVKPVSRSEAVKVLLPEWNT